MLKPYEPHVTDERLVKAMIKMATRNDRKAPKSHKKRNARHGRERGR